MWCGICATTTSTLDRFGWRSAAALTINASNPAGAPPAARTPISRRTKPGSTSYGQASFNLWATSMICAACDAARRFRQRRIGDESADFTVDAARMRSTSPRSDLDDTLT